MRSVELLTISSHTSVRLAEIGFPPILFRGVWFVAADIPALKLRWRRPVSC
jgi:hypothetical protein